MKSVAYVTTTFPTLTAFVEGEVHRLTARGIRVAVFTLRPVGDVYQPAHAPLLALTRPIGSPLHPVGWAALLYWLVRRPHVLVPDVARMLWASRGSFYALAGHAGYLPAAARVARALEAEDFDGVHGAWAHFPASVAWLASRLAGRRFTMSAHAGADLYRTQAFLATKVRAAGFVSTCVRGNADMLRALAGPGARIVSIYHGVDFARFDGQGRTRAATPFLLTVGRLSPPKGFDDAIRALAELKRRGGAPQLVVVGDGPQRPKLEALAREGGVADLVEFRGALVHDELLALYRSAWLLLAPSKVLASGRRDGIPNVIIEAMAMGLPCVGTRAAGLEEAIVPGVTGALCDPGDPRSLADAIERLLRDPADLERMGSNARAHVCTTFDAERNFAALLELFEHPEADGTIPPAPPVQGAASGPRGHA
jgi:colanic acid/amylovoran biosynthesis glycosyltransferase